MLPQTRLQHGLRKNFVRTESFLGVSLPSLRHSIRGCCSSKSCGCAGKQESAPKGEQEAGKQATQALSVKKPKRRSLSGMQRSILALYRSFLRIAFQKTDKESKENLLVHIRSEFQKHRNIDKWDFTRIEYLIHKGERQLDGLKKCKSTDKFQFYRPSPSNSVN